jgi:hypothetical protein
VTDPDIPPVGAALGVGHPLDPRQPEREPAGVPEDDGRRVQRGLDRLRLAGPATVVREQELAGIEALDRRDGRPLV